MLTYIVIFTAIGFAVGHFSNDKKQSLGIILVIAALWGMSHQAVWGLASLGELMLGYFIYEITEGEKAKDSEEKNNE
jgi:phosphate/sulfate permease